MVLTVLIDFPSVFKNIFTSNVEPTVKVPLEGDNSNFAASTEVTKKDEKNSATGNTKITFLKRLIL